MTILVWNDSNIGVNKSVCGVFFLYLVDTMRPVAADGAHKREQYHGIKHTGPAVVFGNPADHGSL